MSNIGSESFSSNDTKIIKGIAIILMLYHHLFFFLDRMPEGTQIYSLPVKGFNLAYYIGFFGKICVAIFVLLSGYGIKAQLLTHNDKSCEKILFKKIIENYLMLWVVIIVFIPICLLVCPTDLSFSFKNLAWNATGIQISFNYEWWFFFPFIMLTVLFPFLNKLLVRIDNLYSEFFCIVLIAIFCNYIQFSLIDFPIFSTFKASYLYSDFSNMLILLPSYMIGIWAFRHNIIERGLKLLRFKYSLIASFICVLMIFLLRYAVGDWQADFFLSLFFIINAIHIMHFLPNIFICNILAYFGKYSGYIWLIHTFFAYKIMPNFIYSFKFSIVIFLICLIISQMSSIILEKICVFFKRKFNLICF